MKNSNNSKMIQNEEKEGRHYLAIKRTIYIIMRNNIKTHDDLYFLNCLHSFPTENKLKSHERVCENKRFCRVAMPSEKDNILEFNQYLDSDKMPCIIYADIFNYKIDIDGCANNPENFSTTKIGEHILCGYSVSTIWAFDHIENKHTLYHGKIS